MDLEALVAVIENKAGSQDFLAEIKATQTIRIPAGHRVQVKCRTKVSCDGEQEQVVYFSPATVDDENIDWCETVSTLKREKQIMLLSR